MRSIFYLDTSGLNFLADNIKDFDFLSAMKEYLGFELFLSPISLWEILLNSSPERQDYLIYWAQFNCSNKLLKSPSEIITQYLKLGCPEKDRRFFFESPYSNLEMGVTWENIHGKIDSNIPMDEGDIKERTAGMRELSKRLKGIVSDMSNESHENYENDPFHKSMIQVLKNLDRCDTLDIKTERTYKIALIFTFFIVCIGFELQNSAVRNFWSEEGIDDPFERLDFIIEHYPTLMVRGPVLEMAIMAETQLQMENSKSRGLLHDCMHAIYCYYADNLLTSDSHFETLRDNAAHPVFDRIIMTSQLNKIWETAIESKSKKSESFNQRGQSRMALS